MDIRSSGESKTSKMKFFSSHVSGPGNADLYTPLIAEADRCRGQLLAEKRDVLVRFLQLSKEPVKGGASDV